MEKELFRLEHRKLWRSSSTRISVVLCFVYVVIFGSILTYQWFGFGSWKEDHTGAFRSHFDGYSNIRENQKYAGKYGQLTEETLQQWVRDYQRMHEAGEDKLLQQTDWHTVNGWLKTLYPELEEADKYMLLAAYVEPDRLTELYERREKALEDYLEISGQTGAEREYLMGMNEKVQEPFSYQWTEGWSAVLGSILSDLGMVLGLFLAVVLSPLFAGEWHHNTSTLVLTTKNGWREVALAKIFTGLVFTLELFAILAAGNIASQVFFLGTEGWKMPIQTIKLIAVAPMNMLQGEIYEYGFTLLGAVGFAGIVMCLSAVLKRNVPALLGSLAVIYAPMMIGQYLPFWLKKALDLVPLVGSAADIFRTNTFCILGRYIWSPYLLITIPVVIGGLCIPLAVKGWARRMRF